MKRHWDCAGGGRGGEDFGGTPGEEIKDGEEKRREGGRQEEGKAYFLHFQFREKKVAAWSLPTVSGELMGHLAPGTRAVGSGQGRGAR
jgi:hypothetical protein